MNLREAILKVLRQGRAGPAPLTVDLACVASHFADEAHDFGSVVSELRSMAEDGLVASGKPSGWELLEAGVKRCDELVELERAQHPLLKSRSNDEVQAAGLVQQAGLVPKPVR